ncbi:MAG: hypothetical protein J5483_01815 [Lachnospiraceae bacterium]|nr:hypothetical protein [Lachnospiraceae bacterium]
MSTHTVFDTIVEEILSDATGAQMLEESMSFDVSRVKNVPIRYRIIALGFVRGYSLNELNDKLMENGCARLYARSLWEAGLIYAFSNRLTYEEWQKLQQVCLEFRSDADEENLFFKGSSISLKELKEYLRAGSEENTTELETKHLTRLVEKRILEAERGEEAFHSFLEENVEAFSLVREKTRYYFCKYLYYLIETRIEQYVAALENDVAVEDAFADLVVLKGISQLKRKKHTPEEAREFLMDTDLSCGEIFDAFNFFYFEYVSLDWMQVLIEYYGNVSSLPDSAVHTLAGYLRTYDPETYRSKDDREVIEILDQKLEDDEAALDEIYSLDGAGRGYQRNRSGENTIRKYIKGTLDIDRTTLLCFLLFFAGSAEIPEQDRINERRLNEILQECGFPMLREEDDFDYFVIQYLNAKDPVGYLMEEVTNYALVEENFYLYRVYQSSTSYNEDFEKLMKEQ